ncbi:MAG: hypothetical protein V1495_07020 [Pseudomonadota bacterium]
MLRKIVGVLLFSGFVACSFAPPPPPKTAPPPLPPGRVAAKECQVSHVACTKTCAAQPLNAISICVDSCSAILADCYKRADAL